jgi:hypothetical protein
LPGHVKKYCWTYTEEDVSDKPWDICEERHGLSPYYLNPEMYNKYHEGQLLRELYLRHAEETRQVVIDEIGPRGEIYHKKCILQGCFTLGREGNIWVPMGLLKFLYPFYLVPEGLGDLSVILSVFLCKSQLQVPTIILYQRKGFYGTFG